MTEKQQKLYDLLVTNPPKYFDMCNRETCLIGTYYREIVKRVDKTIPTSWQFGVDMGFDWPSHTIDLTCSAANMNLTPRQAAEVFKEYCETHTR